ncbi:hypothetical protein [Pseudomonas sp. 7SR1]|uniref:hypothetical protein n=1 Tax=Pseudomonas sp. 7SR1 TaxID=1881017 RepID=UPI000953704D|nr:hypothetical protein [Pseudomonas sp. 7SR1]ROO33390.1 hypothetical protein BIV09_23685 [Pseudomonas sp. 7SR1]SIS23351.1 hypothetical protein SAMN05428955_3449 [Pseudomonas sp. 7SR1]
MKWFFGICIVLATNIMSALLGLTAGINQNPQSTVKFVPEWGSVGDWVSGVGALGAVVVSLYMVKRSERFQLARDSEQLMLAQETGFAYLTLRIGCSGLRTCAVRDVRICHGLKRRSLKRDLSAESEGAFPCKLEPGESIELDWSGLEIKPILSSIKNLEPKSLEGLYFEVVTGIDVHRFDVERQVIDLLKEAEDAFEVHLLADAKPLL